MSNEGFANRFKISVGHAEGTPHDEFAAIMRNDSKYLDLVEVDLLINLKALSPNAYIALMVLAQEFTEGWEDA